MVQQNFSIYAIWNILGGEPLASKLVSRFFPLHMNNITKY